MRRLCVSRSSAGAGGYCGFLAKPSSLKLVSGGRCCSSWLRRRRCLSTQAAETQWDYDVLVVGGGVVGSSLACRLAQTVGKTHGLRVGLVEGRPPRPLTEAHEAQVPDPRVYSLTPATVSFLDSMGAWEPMAGRFQDFQQMQVWEGQASGSIRFDAKSGKQARLGTIAENNMLQAVLFEKLQALKQEGLVDVQCPAQVQAIRFQEDTSPPGPALVTLASGPDGVKREVSVRLLVGADGANSRVKKAAGLPSWGWDYGQRAVVATVKTDNLPSAAITGGATAWQVFLKNGPLALLPLWGDYRSIVWSTTPAHAEHLRSLDNAAFLAELNAALRTPVALLDKPQLPAFIPSPLSSALGGVHHLLESIIVSAALNTGFHLPPLIADVCSPRLSFDLRLEHAKSYVGPRVALAGDAAHTIHPMAGQGLNLGIYDVIALAELIEKGVATGQDLGSATFLASYERARQPANLAMITSLDALHRLYAPEAGPARWLRNVGLGALNGLGPVKAGIVKYAMGLAMEEKHPSSSTSGTSSSSTGGQQERAAST